MASAKTTLIILSALMQDLKVDSVIAVALPAFLLLRVKGP
jgi:hypothetical protein